jgi:threonine/homoserine/homoserine lactone efflux protein
MDLIFLFFGGVLTGLSGAMIPGPLFLFTVSESLKKNSNVGIRVVIGHMVVETLLIVLILIGLKEFLQSAIFIKTISLLGAAALMSMGIILIKNTSTMSLSAKKQVDFDYGVISGGAFFSAISPGFIIWWATIGASIFVQALLSGIIGVILLVSGHWLADAVWHWFVSFSVNKGKQYLSDAIYQKIIQLLALGLIFMGVYFLGQFLKLAR